MKVFKTLFFAITVISCLLDVAIAGPAAYGICQTGCNAVAYACYAAAGFTFGTVTGGTGVPAAIMGCNASLGVCMASCIVAGFLPTP